MKKLNRKKSDTVIYVITVIAAFVMFLSCVVLIHFAFPIEENYTEAEIRYLKDNGYLHDNVIESLGHDLNNAWLNLQDLVKGDK